MDELTHLHRKAEKLSRERRWDEAAVAYGQLGDAFAREKRDDGVRWALDAAGEAWRRADRPQLAVRALHRALQLAPGEEAAALGCVKLAGSLAELGEMQDAEELCRDALRHAPHGAIRGVALDTLMSLLQAKGRLDEAKRALVELEALDAPQARIAALFRRGQLERHAGDFLEAALCLGEVIETLQEVPEAVAGVAAAKGELAEIALLRGDVRDAVDFFERAVAEHDQAARHSLLLRAEAGRVRAMVEAGIQPLVPLLEDGVAFAETRGMVSLEVDLRIARGMARTTTDPALAIQDLDRAINAADAIEVPFRAGRARYERAVRTPVTTELARTLLERAEAQLEGSAPWVARIRLAVARLLRDVDPDRALRAAVSAAARFDAMEMVPDAVEAHALVRRLS